MSKTIQLVQIDPEELVELINTSVKNLFNDFLKEITINNSDELLTPPQVCDLLQIDNSTLWRWGQKGKVKTYGISGRRYYKKNELLESLVPVNNSSALKLNNFNVEYGR